VGALANRYWQIHRRARSGGPRSMSWSALIEIEEQAFFDLGFQSRHDPAIVDAFLRLKDSRLAGPNLDEPADWRRDDEQLPAVYVIVRALMEAKAEATHD
jgi:Protein of unknown function (DUF2471)